VHLAQGLGHPPPVAADAEKEVADLGRGAEGLVDQVERVLHRPLHVDAQLEAELVAVPEDLDQAQGLFLEGAPVGLGETQLLVDDDEPVREGLLPEAALHAPAAGEGLAAARDQAARHAMDHPRVEIVVAHELLDPERQLVGDVAEVLRDLGLDVARQHVVLVAGEEVQLVAHAPQEGQGLVARLLLPTRNQSLVRQLSKSSRPELGGGQPHRGVDVAQAARRLLDVGLAHVRRAAELAVALVALRERRLEELGEVLLVDVLGQDLPEAIEEPAVAHQIAGLLHRGAARKVGAGHGQAVRQATHRVPDLQAQIPERVEQALGDALDVGAHLPVVDQHQVEVGERVELAAPVAAEGHQHQRSGGQRLAPRVVHHQAVERGQEAVHEGGVGLHRLLAGGPAQVGGTQKVDIRGEMLAQDLEPQAASTLRQLGRVAVEPLLGLRLDPADLSQQFRGHGETVAWTKKKVKLGANLCRSYCRRYNYALCDGTGGACWTRWHPTTRANRSRWSRESSAWRCCASPPTKTRSAPRRE
jgi:hypothetical protein